MSNPNNFDEASAATEEMFANDQQIPDNAPQEDNIYSQADNQNTDDPADYEPYGEPDNGTDSATPPEQTATDTEQLEQAAQTAEIAAQAAAQRDSQLQQAIAEIEALKEQNQQLQGAIDEISRQNTENIVKDALKPPELDINSLAFADEATQKNEMARFVEAMSAYNRKQLMNELTPAIEFAKKGMYDAEKAETIEALAQIPELSNIQTMLPQLDRIIQKNRWLQSDDMPMDEKYINAYAMVKGVDSINNPPAPPEPEREPTTDELMELYNSNQDFRDLVEKQRLEQLKQSQQVPPFSASSGAVNAALDIKEKPQTLEEASKRTREMFGSMM